MSIFYSALTNGFYVTGIHGTMPDDAVPISDERHAELMEGQMTGLEIRADEHGEPVAAEPAPPGAPELARVVRAQRNRLLDASDKRMAPDYPQSRPSYEAWARYRESLRRITEQPGFPANVSWPRPPA
jgi:hypothetical protein